MVWYLSFRGRASDELFFVPTPQPLELAGRIIATAKVEDEECVAANPCTVGLALPRPSSDCLLLLCRHVTFAEFHKWASKVRSLLEEPSSHCRLGLRF